MNKKRRLTIFLFVVTFIIGIFVGNILIPPITLNSGISVYRTSAENPNRTLSTYADIVRSEKHSVIQPYEFPNDMQYVVTVKRAYDSISVSAYRSEQREWEEVEIVDLGNDQYSIDAIPVFYNSGYGKRTVTYCISICKGENVQKHYFTTRHD